MENTPQKESSIQEHNKRVQTRREAQRLELLKRELAKPTAERVRQLLK